MANPENITEANAKRTLAERREIARKGGIASGEARRERKAMRELLDIAMSEVYKNPKTGEIKTRDEWAAVALAKRAMKGDVTAYRTIAEMRGENAPLKIDANVKQEQTSQISFGDMDVTAMATFLADVKEQAKRQQEEQGDEQ